MHTHTDTPVGNVRSPGLRLQIELRSGGAGETPFNGSFEDRFVLQRTLSKTWIEAIFNQFLNVAFPPSPTVAVPRFPTCCSTSSVLLQSFEFRLDAFELLCQLRVLPVGPLARVKTRTGVCRRNRRTHAKIKEAKTGRRRLTSSSSVLLCQHTLEGAWCTAESRQSHRYPLPNAPSAPHPHQTHHIR